MVKALYAPVIEPGLIKYFFSYSYTYAEMIFGVVVRLHYGMLLNLRPRFSARVGEHRTHTHTHTHLVLVRVAGDEDVDVELALQIGERLGVAPRDNLHTAKKKKK